MVFLLMHLSQEDSDSDNENDMNGGNDSDDSNGDEDADDDANITNQPPSQKRQCNRMSVFNSK